MLLAFALVANPMFAGRVKASVIPSGNIFIENQMAGDGSGQEFNGTGEGPMNRWIDEGGDDGGSMVMSKSREVTRKTELVQKKKISTQAKMEDLICLHG